MVVARNGRIYIDSFDNIMLRKHAIVKSVILLPSITLRCLPPRLPVCRLEKPISDSVGYHEVDSPSIELLNLIVVDIYCWNYQR